MNIPILSFLIWLPICSGFLLLFISKTKLLAPNLILRDQVAKWWGFFTSIIILIMACWMYYNYTSIVGCDVSHQSAMRYFEGKAFFSLPGFGEFGHYMLGVDSVSIYFILLAALLTPICIVVTWQSIGTNIALYIFSFLLLEGILIGFFCAIDLIMFYILFEIVLVPMFLLILVWGGEKRVYASYKFFLYTFAGSLLMLLAIIYLIAVVGTSNLLQLEGVLPKQINGMGWWLWLGFFLAFAVKVPMWPLHTWLPDAHVQAPTGGSVMLAGVLLKMGGYGMLRILLPLFPQISSSMSEVVLILSTIAVVYTSIVALMQEDMKKLIAYSSVAHMGYVTAGLFSNNAYGITGAILQMLSHGLISAGLFIIVGLLYDQTHTKEIARYRGIASKMPRLGALFVVFSLASIAVPGTSGFVGEFTSLIGVFMYKPFYAILMCLALVLGAAYMLWLVARVVFGKANAEVSKLDDIGLGNYIALLTLALFILWIGIYSDNICDHIKLVIGCMKQQPIIDVNFK